MLFPAGSGTGARFGSVAGGDTNQVFGGARKVCESVVTSFIENVIFGPGAQEAISDVFLMGRGRVEKLRTKIKPKTITKENVNIYKNENQKPKNNMNNSKQISNK